MSKRRLLANKLTADEAASLEYMLELLETMGRISAKHDFDFLSYLLSLSQTEIIDILSYSTSARKSKKRRA